MTMLSSTINLGDDMGILMNTLNPKKGHQLLHGCIAI